MIVRELLATLGFKVDHAGIDKWEKRIEANKKAIEKLKGTADAAGRALAFMAKAGAAAFVGLGVAAATVGGEFESLRASLKTVTGSSEAATEAFDRIKKFASTTPFSVKEATTAFIKLKALGLDPSEAALKSYGNTSSAMGKSLNEMIEAVADAATGEFERLKEFGIKARSEGDQVSFTFQGVTTTVGKNAKEIEGYLRTIGDVQFAGAMDEQAKTFRGVMSNLQDSAEGFLDRVAQGGFLDALKDIGRELGSTSIGGEDLAQTLGKALGDAARSLFDTFKKFIPQIPRVVDMFTRFVGVALKLADVAMTLINAFGGPEGLVYALIGIKVGLGGVTTAMTAMEAATSLGVGAVGKLGLAFGALAIAVGGAMLILAHYQEKIDELRRHTQDIVDETQAGWAEGGAVDQALRGYSDEELRDRARSMRAGTGSPEAIAAIEREQTRRAREGAKGTSAEAAALAGVTRMHDAYADTASQLISDREELRGLQRKSRKGPLSPTEKKRATALQKQLNTTTKMGKGPKGKKDKKELTPEEILERDFGNVVKDKESGHLRAPLGTTINRIEIKPQTTVTIPVTQRSGESGDDLAKRVAGIVTIEIGKVVRASTDHFKGPTVG